MCEFEQRIQALDISLFDKVPSQSTAADRLSLLALQRAVRNTLGNYVYLEIGSHLGGSLQTHLADPQCQSVYSIDNRPLAQPDERAIEFHYEGNSTERMLRHLRAAYPESMDKLLTIEDNAGNVNCELISPLPNLCFIDGEHTNAAVFSDFHFCCEVSSPSAIVCFHDANLVFHAITEVKRYLHESRVPFTSMKLGGTVFVILLREATNLFRNALLEFAMDETAFFKKAHLRLALVKQFNRCRGWLGGLTMPHDRTEERHAG